MLSRILRGQKGAFLVLTAILVPVIFLFTCLAADLGKGFFENMKWAKLAFPDTMSITYLMYDENNPLNRAGN